MTLELAAVLLTALGAGGVLAELLKRLFFRLDRVATGDSAVEIHRMDDRAKLTRELWDRIEALERQVKDLQIEVDSWREQYHQRGADILKLEGEVRRLSDLLDRSMGLGRVEDE